MTQRLFDLFDSTISPPRQESTFHTPQSAIYYRHTFTYHLILDNRPKETRHYHASALLPHRHRLSRRGGVRPARLRLEDHVPLRPLRRGGVDPISRWQRNHEPP